MRSAPVLRVMDANLNRAREGLRVCEEVARLILNDSRLTRRCRDIRHGLNAASNRLPIERLIRHRDVAADPGRPAVRGMSRGHRRPGDLLIANARRIEESLRVLEECARLESPAWSRQISALRFRVYALEKDLLRRLSSLRHR